MVAAWSGLIGGPTGRRSCLAATRTSSFDHARRIDEVYEPNSELGELLGSFGVAENPVPCERDMQPEQQIQGARDLCDELGTPQCPLGVLGLRLPGQGIGGARQCQRGFRRRAGGGAQRPQKSRQRLVPDERDGRRRRLPKLDLDCWTRPLAARVRKPTRTPTSPQRVLVEARSIGHLPQRQPLDITPKGPTSSVRQKSRPRSFPAFR